MRNKGRSARVHDSRQPLDHVLSGSLLSPKRGLELSVAVAGQRVELESAALPKRWDMLSRSYVVLSPEAMRMCHQGGHGLDTIGHPCNPRPAPPAFPRPTGVGWPDQGPKDPRLGGKGGLSPDGVKVATRHPGGCRRFILVR